MTLSNAPPHFLQVPSSDMRSSTMETAFHLIKI
jgi:hypothetical protein